MKQYFLLLIVLFIKFNTSAQTKQDIYCNPDIVWAGMIEVDFVVDADTSTDWKLYKASGLHEHFKQKTAETNPKKTLNKIVVGNAHLLQFYRQDSLKYKIHYQELDIRNWENVPDTYGDDWERIPASMFNVFRLKSIIYYDKSTLEFKIIPQAVAVLYPNEDSDVILSYGILGWLPVEYLPQAIKINAENSILNFQFQRDFSFEAVKVFKQEWTTEETINNFMATIRRKAETIKLYEPFDDTLMDEEEIKLLGLEQISGLRFDAYEETEEYVPWSAEEYKGIRFSINWFWNEETKALSVLTTDFSPLVRITDDADNVLYLNSLFLKKY